MLIASIELLTRPIDLPRSQLMGEQITLHPSQYAGNIISHYIDEPEAAEYELFEKQQC